MAMFCRRSFDIAVSEEVSRGRLANEVVTCHSMQLMTAVRIDLKRGKLCAKKVKRERIFRAHYHNREVEMGAPGRNFAGLASLAPQAQIS